MVKIERSCAVAVCSPHGPTRKCDCMFSLAHLSNTVGFEAHAWPLAVLEKPDVELLENLPLGVMVHGEAIVRNKALMNLHNAFHKQYPARASPSNTATMTGKRVLPSDEWTSRPQRQSLHNKDSEATMTEFHASHREWKSCLRRQSQKHARIELQVLSKRVPK